MGTLHLKNHPFPSFCWGRGNIFASGKISGPKGIDILYLSERLYS